MSLLVLLQIGIPYIVMDQIVNPTKNIKIYTVLVQVACVYMPVLLNLSLNSLSNLLPSHTHTHTHTHFTVSPTGSQVP